MNDPQPVPTGPPLSPAVAVAIAITSATGIRPAEVTTEVLLGDVDPVEVVKTLGSALHAALGILLGEDGRAVMLQHIGLANAREQP